MEAAESVIDVGLEYYARRWQRRLRADALSLRATVNGGVGLPQPLAFQAS